MSDFRPGPGALVAVDLTEPGGAQTRVAGRVQCFVLNDGAEYDVVLSPVEYADPDSRADLEDILARCDLDLGDLREGPVYVLRNVQPEQITWSAS